MSEASPDKTKRRYIKLLTDYQWSYRYSVFYDDLTLSSKLITDKEEFQQRLRKEFPEQPFLIRVQTKVGGLVDSKALQAYLTILTTAKSERLKQVVHESFASDMNIMSGPLSDRKLKSITCAIENQRLHDLKKIFGGIRIKRYSVLNKAKLQPVQE
jgi:hypothetical protein